MTFDEWWEKHGDPYDAYEAAMKAWEFQQTCLGGQLHDAYQIARDLLDSDLRHGPAAWVALQEIRDATMDGVDGDDC